MLTSLSVCFTIEIPNVGSSVTTSPDGILSRYQGFLQSLMPHAELRGTGFISTGKSRCM